MHLWFCDHKFEILNHSTPYEKNKTFRIAIVCCCCYFFLILCKANSICFIATWNSIVSGMFVCLNFDIFHFFWWLGCVHYYARIGAFLSLSFREIYCCCRHRRRRWRQGEFKLRAKIHIDDLCQCRYFIELMAFSVVCCTTIIYIFIVMLNAFQKKES